MPRVYVKTVPLKLRLTEPVVTFVKAMARRLGVNPSELVRRILIDARQQWIDRGLYDPELDTEKPSTESLASIDFQPGENDTVRIAFPEGLSPVARKDVQEALKRHVPELKALVEPLHRKKVS